MRPATLSLATLTASSKWLTHAAARNATAAGDAAWHLVVLVRMSTFCASGSGSAVTSDDGPSKPPSLPFAVPPKSPRVCSRVAGMSCTALRILSTHFLSLKARGRPPHTKNFRRKRSSGMLKWWPNTRISAQE